MSRRSGCGAPPARIATFCARWRAGSLRLGAAVRPLRHPQGKETRDSISRGSLLIVAIARLSALEAGSRARGTIDRLAAAELVLGSDAATLAEGFRYLVGCASSWRSIGAARRLESGHRIHLAALNALERRFLGDIFTLLRDVRDGLVARFAL